MSDHLSHLISLTATTYPWQSPSRRRSAYKAMQKEAQTETVLPTQ